MEMSEQSSTVCIHFFMSTFDTPPKTRLNIVLIYISQALDNNGSFDEEEVEPKLKYARISNDLKAILSRDAVSCIAVNSKVCLTQSNRFV